LPDVEKLVLKRKNITRERSTFRPSLTADLLRVININVKCDYQEAANNHNTKSQIRVASETPISHSRKKGIVCAAPPPGVEGCSCGIGCQPPLNVGMGIGATRQLLQHPFSPSHAQMGHRCRTGAAAVCRLARPEGRPEAALARPTLANAANSGASPRQTKPRRNA
jgi:hypothetical protein